MGPIESFLNGLLEVKPIAFIGWSTPDFGSSTGNVGSSWTPGTGVTPL